MLGNKLGNCENSLQKVCIYKARRSGLQIFLLNIGFLFRLEKCLHVACKGGQVEGVRILLSGFLSSEEFDEKDEG